MTDALRTPRLRLERWTDAHLGVLLELSALPEVTRYVGDGQVWTPERARESHALALRRWHELGFGWRAVIATATGAPVALISCNLIGDGVAGLDPDQHEIGWWTAPASWGRGIAPEAASAVRDDLFSRVGAPSVVALIQPANVASAKVAARLGMVPAGETTGRADDPVVVHRVTRGTMA
jgi:RimJ/RimL family protein N-acetyltransferase